MLYFEKDLTNFQIWHFSGVPKIQTNLSLLGQILSFIPRYLLNHLVKKHQTDKGCSKYKTYSKSNTKVIDSTTISLCLSMFDWAKFRTAKGGLKIHTVWDEQLVLPEMVNITEAKVHDSKGLEQNIYPKNTIIVEDRAYLTSI